MDTVIIGAGGHGRVVLDILRAGGRYKPTAFLDANPSLHHTQVAGVSIAGSVNMLPRLAAQKIRFAIVAIGESRARLTYARIVEDAGIELINAIHPSASVAQSATLGRNIVVAAGAIVGPDARLADSTIINHNAVVDHECEVGAGVHVCPGALLAGRVRVGAGAFIGLGAKVIQCLTIGDDAIVGAGSVVLNDIPAGATVAGVPACAIKPLARAAG